MTSVQPVNDPYWELERYLELAQEEIGRAFDDLKDGENSSDGKEFLGSRRTKHDIINEKEGPVFRNTLSIPEIHRVNEHPKISQKLSCPSNLEYKSFRSEFYSCMSESKYNLSLDENLWIHSDDDDVFYSDNEDCASEHIPADNGHQRFASCPNTDHLARSTERHTKIVSCPLKCENFDLLSGWVNNLLSEIDETFSKNSHDETNLLFSSPLETFENECQLDSKKTYVCENNYLSNKRHLTKSCCSTQNNEMCKFSVRYNFKNKCLEKPKVTRHCSYSGDLEQSGFQKLPTSDLSPRRSSCSSDKSVVEKLTFKKELIPTTLLVKHTSETTVQTSDVDFFVQRKTGGENLENKCSSMRSRSEIGGQTSLVSDIDNEHEAIINRSFNSLQKDVHLPFGTAKMVITELGTAAFSSLEDHKQISDSANKIIDGVEELFDATVSSSENHLFAGSDSMKKEFDREIYKSSKAEKNNQIVEVDEFEKANRTSNRFPIECKGQNSSLLYHYNVNPKSKTHSTYERFISKYFTSLKRSKTEDDISILKEWKVANTQKSQSDDDVSLGIKLVFDDHKHDVLLLPFETRERGPDFKAKAYAFSNIVTDTLCSRNIEHNNAQEIPANNLESLTNTPLTMRPYFENVNRYDNNVSLRKGAYADSMKSVELEPIEVYFNAVSPLDEDESKISHTCKQNVVGNDNKSVADRSRVIKRTWQKAMSKKTSYLDDKVNFPGSLKDDFINGNNYPYSNIITHQHNSVFNEALLLNNRRRCSSEINISGRNVNVETNEVRSTKWRSLCNLNQLSNSETVSEYSGSSSTVLSENQYKSVHLMRKMENCAYQTRPPQRCELNNDSENEVPSGQVFVFQDTNIKRTTRPYRSFTWMNENRNTCEELLQTQIDSSLSKERLSSFSSSSISEVLSDVSGSSLAKSTDVHWDDKPELDSNYFKIDDIDNSSDGSLSLSECSIQSEHGSDGMYRTEEQNPLNDNLGPTIQHSSELPDSADKNEIGVSDSIESTRNKSQISNAKPNNSCICSLKNYYCSKNQLNTISRLGDDNGKNVLEVHSNLSLPETSKLFKLSGNDSDKSSSVYLQTLPLPVQKARNNGYQSVRLISPVKRKISKGNKNEQATRTSTRAKIFLRKMNIKSSSAPLLRLQHDLGENSVRLAQSVATPDDVNCLQKMTVEENKVFNSPRSQSFKELSELEAIEACNWLKAAGFPQYSQLYEDGLFPIDISSVQEDHKFLDPDSIQALFRRLNTLNKCAKMKVENLPKKYIQPLEESDEEQCALSENWQFQLINRRWSRIPLPVEYSVSVNKHLHTPEDYYPDNQFTSSHDNVFVDDNQSCSDSTRGAFSANCEENMIHNHLPVQIDEDHSTSGSRESTSCGSEKSLDLSENDKENIYCNESERFKDSAKAILRKTESLKVKHKKMSWKTIVDGGQHVSMGLASDSLPGSKGEKSSDSSLASSPQTSCHKISQEISSDFSSLQDEESDGSQQSTPQLQQKTKWHIAHMTDLNAFNDSESSTPNLSHHLKDANSNIAENDEKEELSGPGSKVKHVFLDKDLSGTKENENYRYKNKKVNKSYPDDKPVKKVSTLISKKRNEERDRQVNSTPNPIIVLSQISSIEQTTNRLNKLFTVPFLTQTNDDQTPPESNSVFYTSLTPDNFEIEVNSSQDETEKSVMERQDSGVGSSLTRSSLSSTTQIRWHWFPSIRRQSSVNIRTVTSHGLHISSLSASQLMKLRKLALLKLTSLMEKHNPTSRSGWNWGVPKFIRKIRTPDYKDKVVFGVPLLLILQRTGQPLPPSIEVAIRYLRKTALDAVGLFRKSGVRSRIQKLKNLNDSNPASLSYENQQAYDIADMLKQYFRELPDALLTNKLSETFISIFQYIPVENRKEAIQAAVLLMPDENREVLQSLLAFLQEICQRSDENQMTATNLSVCFAPSLFQLTIPRSASASPRRRKVVGVPDQKELNENRAAHECLTYMINNYRQLFSVKEENLRLANAEQLEPPTFEELGSQTNQRNYSWKTYVEIYLQGLHKEARDKFKSWLVVPHHDCVEVSYKKIDDGHPLRLWKVSVEIEAPPLEVLNRILRERNVWDESIVKWRVVCKLDNQCEVFHHVCNSVGPHPARDYCVLRSWRTDSPKGSCMLFETSIDHPDAPPLPGSVRGVVLVSHFLVEPCGAGKSRLTHINRVDTRGRSPEWYNKAFGHICALQLICLRDSFKHGTEGPETKV